MHSEKDKRKNTTQAPFENLHLHKWGTNSVDAPMSRFGLKLGAREEALNVLDQFSVFFLQNQSVNFLGALQAPKMTSKNPE